MISKGIIWFLMFIYVNSAPPKNIDEPKCGYESCHPVKEGFVNVHIVPHTHDDVGWLKTVDQYYYGSKPFIQKAGVQYILDSVLDELRKDPNRRFIYVETSYLWKWWKQQHDKVKLQFRKFIRNGQLEIIGGAWSMNDEAVTHYQSIIDQFTWGLRKLNDTFGECGRPKVGWQIDPFGHSREMASIFSQLGFDGLLLGRIDYQDKRYRFQSKSPEVVWQGSDNLGNSSQLFTSVLFNNYSPPPTFCFDILCDDPPIVDDKKSPEYNVDERVKTFLDYVKNMTNVYSTNNVIITMGEDFTYQDAHLWFKNLDKLIFYANQLQANGSRYNLIYSTPSCYLKAVHDEAKTHNLQFQLKTDDFFPYASDPNAYWTGYFTSKPTIKRFERVGNNFLQVCKQLYVLADLGPEDWADLNALREAMGVMQHHDAITGTEKEDVAHDYERILSTGMQECEFAAATALSKLAIKRSHKEVLPGQDPAPEIPFTSCLLSNISQCEFTENNDNFIATIYNPLSRLIHFYVRLPVVGQNYTVRDITGRPIPVQFIPIPDTIKNIPGRSSKATFELIFLALNLLPLGFNSYYIQKGGLAEDEVHDENVNGYGGPSVTIDPATGLITGVTLREKSIPLKQEFLFYRGTVGDNSKSTNRSSGAYIFRPNGTEAFKVMDKATVKIFKGPIITEIHQVFNEWVSQIIRTYNKENFIEFDWLVGPIPMDEISGREIISRFTTDINSESIFYTDSNGRELLKRVRNFRPTWKMDVTEPISGNYYPVTSKILIRDTKQDLELAVLTDRAQGGSSLKDGEIELMVHRNCRADDGFGVGEALYEKSFEKGLVARGSHYLMVGGYIKNRVMSLALEEREVAQRKLLSAWTFVSPTNGLPFDQYKAQHVMRYWGMKGTLPKNVQLLTLEPWIGMNFLLRLEHILEKYDDPVLSRPITVNLQGLFVPFEIVSFRETTLGANQWLDENERLRFEVGRKMEECVENLEDDQDEFWAKGLEKWRIDQRESNDVNESYFGYAETEENAETKAAFLITLNPMQIRTYVIEVKMV